MVKRIALVLVMVVGATLVVALLSGFSGAGAFAAIQENGDPCPPECVTDTLVIDTWYPSPWNEYEELYTMKLGVGDVTEPNHEAKLKPKSVGSVKVARSVVFTPMDTDPEPDVFGNYPDAEEGELIYNGSEDTFKYFNGQAWVPQGGGSSWVCQIIYNNDPSLSPACPNGWNKEAILGIWGFCQGAGAPNGSGFVYPPGGSSCPYAGLQNIQIGQASLCCKQ